MDQTIDPVTGQTIARVQEATAADVDAAVDAARAALDGPWRRLSASERDRLVGRLADLTEAHAEGLAALVSLSSGKIVGDARE